MKKKSMNDEGAKPNFGRRGRRGALVCLVAATAMTGGCYGRFPMTHALYDMNGRVDNGIVKNVVFWLFVWFPVYWFAQIGDAVIFNVIEFWTGSELNLGAVSTEDGTTVTLRSSEDRNTLYMTVTKEGEPEIKSSFVRMGDGQYELRDEQDRLAGKIIRTPEGNLDLTDAEDRTLQTINPAEIAARSGE